MSRTTRRFFQLGYLLVPALLVANGVLTFLNLRTILRGNRWIDHTREVVIELERAISTLKDAETGQRGYLLTEDESYLEPFRVAERRLGGILDGLAGLTSDNPSQRRRFAVLRRLSEEKLAELRQTVALRRGAGPEKALAVVRTHRGKRVMERARAVVVEMAQEEERLLTERVAWSRSASRRTFATSSIATALELGLLGLVFAAKRREDAEQEGAAAAIRRAEERLRLIVDSAEDYAIFALNLDSRISSWNTGARNLTGFEEGEVIGRTPEFLFIPEDNERGVPALEVRKATEQGRALNERWHLRKDGSRFWASGLLMPMREGGRIVGYLKIMRDTTDRKRVEEELELSRARLDLVVNSSEVGLWYCDLPFDKLVWNPKCKEHFGLSPGAEVTIETFYERLHPEDRERARGAIERAIERRADYDIEYRTVAPDGRLRWIRAIGRPFYDPAGVAMRFDGITVDVTERIRQEEALREADRRKDEFLATLAHELRNPLAPIRNALHLMRDPDDCREFERERAMAERQVAHLTRLVDDLMDVARITKGRVELRRESVDLGEVLGRAVESARPLMAELGHRLEVRLPDEPIRLDGDPTRLEQVFWNLLNNAAKYTEPRGDVRLEAAREDGQAVVRVRDTGIGIPEEKLSSIFEMFVQVDRRSSRAKGGLGIGLGLVKTLVELHGGSIRAASAGTGRGSEFEVRLPVPAGPAAGPAGAEPAGSARAAEPPRRRVLVVDDNRDAAESLARMLARRYRQDVRVAYSGPSALAEAGSFRPDLILLDIGMPEMDGHEVARLLRARPGFERTTLVALTGWGQEADRARSRASGFDRHLVKPVEPDQLVGLLCEVDPA